ncbi:unnamed protein product, partial [Iphiclides podalirius]
MGRRWKLLDWVISGIPRGFLKHDLTEATLCGQRTCRTPMTRPNSRRQISDKAPITPDSVVKMALRHVRL